MVEIFFTCIRKLKQNVWFHFSTPCISETPISGNISTIMLVRNLESVAGVHLIQILTFVLHSNWFIIDIFRKISAKMLLFCKVMLFHTSVSSKSFCGLVLLTGILGNCVGGWVSVCFRLLFDVRTAEISAPGWVITMPSAHLRCLKLTWYVHHKHDSLSLFNLLVCVCVI